MYPARIALCKALEAAPAQSVLGQKATSHIFRAKLKLFAKAGSASPTTLSLNEIDGQEIDVINATTSAIEIDQDIMVAQAVDRRWVVVEGGGTGAEVVAFQVPGTPYGTPTAQCWYVKISAANPTGPSDDPPQPTGTTTLYKGRSYDNYSSGAAYHSYLWIFQTCNSDLNVGEWIENGPGGGEPSGTNLIGDWAADIYTGANGNLEWGVSAVTTTQCDRDTHITLIDTLLQQPGSPVDYTVLDITALIDSDDCDPDDLCVDGDYIKDQLGRSLVVNVIARPCGVSKVSMETDEGQITVYDTIGSFMYGRDAEDAKGRYGFAALLQEDGAYSCKWVITWLDWFEPLQVVHDIVFGANGITIERFKIDVWRKCKLPTEYILGETCEEIYSS